MMAKPQRHCYRILLPIHYFKKHCHKSLVHHIRSLYLWYLNQINIIYEILRGLEAGSGQSILYLRRCLVYEFHITPTVMDKDILYFVTMFFRY